MSAVGLIVAKSQIPNAGEGVFTTSHIPADTTILEYTGDFVNEESLTDDQAIYAVDIGFGISIVGNNIASKINDIIMFDKLDSDATRELIFNDIIPIYPDKQYNCKFVVEKNGIFGRAFIKTICDIEPNTELYIKYGSNYWLHRFLVSDLVDAELVRKYRTLKFASVTSLTSPTLTTTPTTEVSCM